jgi:glycosyltransferase involved in cell wall biosynthesis
MARSLPFGLLHRHLWQRLPRDWRRSALFYATGLAAPRPSPMAEPDLPILVAGALRTASGLGESARLCHDALKAAGMPVGGIDLTNGLMQRADHPDFVFDDAHAWEGPGTLILHVNSPLVPLAILRLGRRLVQGKRIVGYWAWELPDVPPDWRHGIPFVHEIWVPSQFTARAVTPIANGRPVHVVPHPIAVNTIGHGAPKPAARVPYTALTIFDMASSLARKNPSAAIEAFRKAFGSDPTTRLIVKASNLSSFPEGRRLIESAVNSASNVVLIDKILSDAERGALYDQADAVMSLHRSEGFGLTLAEAMLRGLPVVATNWSGNVDFMNEETGILIPCRLIPAEDPQGTYHHPDMMWAEPDIDAAALALRQLREDPALRARLGARAAQFAARTWSAQAYVATVRQHLGV